MPLSVFTSTSVVILAMSEGGTSSFFLVYNILFERQFGKLVISFLP
jgi:hypothetical protein